MQVTVHYGQGLVRLEVDAGRILGGMIPAGPDVEDPAEAVRAALQTPFEYPPLRQALTPDDHVTVVVDEGLPHPGRLLVPILDELNDAGVTAEAITILVPPSTTGQPWIEDLPDRFQEARVEVHDPAERKRLRYLATTKAGRRLYLNQCLVDADLVIVLSGRRYDPVLGISGAGASIFPALSDSESRAALSGEGRLTVPGDEPWPIMEEANEAAWLLGAPFFVQIIEGAGDGVAAVVAGSTEATVEGRHQLETRWLTVVPQAADLVVASISGDPERQTFDDLAAAAACAARVVRPGGRIVILSEIATPPGPAFESLLGVEDPGDLASATVPNPNAEQVAVARWAAAAAHARLTVLSRLDAETLEELFATPLEDVSRVQRLLDAGGTCLFIEDAHKTMAVPAEE